MTMFAGHLLADAGLSETPMVPDSINRSVDQREPGPVDGYAAVALPAAILDILRFEIERRQATSLVSAYHNALLSS